MESFPRFARCARYARLARFPRFARFARRAKAPEVRNVPRLGKALSVDKDPERSLFNVFLNLERFYDMLFI